MLGRISDADKERVRDAARIEAVVGDYVALRRAGGGNLKGLCPFHDEKTPSFNVNPGRGTYHCFGCGQGGDVFTFVSEVEHLTFVEAVQRLADRAGITLSLVEGGTTANRERGSRSRLISVTKAAAAFFAAQLENKEAEPARAFLAERGFDMATAAHFGCGYAPGGWDQLIKALTGQGFTIDELYRAGVARAGQRGPIDQFHRRLLWAIRDPSGDVVGFGARRLFDDDRLEAKYINTSETPLYHKSQVLFGLDLAKRDIGRQRQVVVVEGYTDVMAMHLAGVTTAVASCGTAFGEEHIDVLRRYLLDSEVIRGEVIYTFDGDAAGKKAALKAFDSDQRFAANTSIAVAPDGMDPCELRQAKGDAAVRELVTTRRPLFEFAIRTILAEHDLETAEGRVAATAAAVPLVSRIKEETLRAEYTRQLAGWVGSELGPIQARVRAVTRDGRNQPRRSARRGESAGRGEGAGRSGGPGGADQQPGYSGQRVVGDGVVGRPGDRPDVSRPADRPGSVNSDRTGDDAHGQAATDRSAPRRPNPADPAIFAEREMLKLVLQQPSLVSGGYDQVESSAFTHPAYAALHEAVSAAGGPAAAPHGAAWVSTVSDHLPAGPLRSLVTELAVEPPRHRAEESDPQYAGAILARMAERVAAVQERDLHSALLRAEAGGDTERFHSLQADLIAMAAYRRALADRARGES